MMMDLVSRLPRPLRHAPLTPQRPSHLAQRRHENNNRIHLATECGKIPCTHHCRSAGRLFRLGRRLALHLGMSCRRLLRLRISHHQAPPGLSTRWPCRRPCLTPLRYHLPVCTYQRHPVNTGMRSSNTHRRCHQVPARRPRLHRCQNPRRWTTRR